MSGYAPPRHVLWQKLRRDEIRAAAERRAVVVLPLGAVEQHGPHLPLDTDSYTAFTLSAMAAERVDEFPVLVLPPIWWGLSPYWMVFPGTITLVDETLMRLVADIARGVSHHGFARLLLVNGHGGNIGLIHTATARVTTETLRVAALSYWSLVPDLLKDITDRDAGLIGHAGEIETSIQLHLQPESVDLGTVTQEQCLDLKSHARIPGPTGRAAYVPPDPRRESPHGIYGFPPAGTAEKGRRIVEAVVTQLAELYRAFRA